jgi:hypothetical protein
MANPDVVWMRAWMRVRWLSLKEWENRFVLA